MWPTILRQCETIQMMKDEKIFDNRAHSPFCAEYHRQRGAICATEKKAVSRIKWSGQSCTSSERRSNIDASGRYRTQPGTRQFAYGDRSTAHGSNPKE